jgi:sulfatase maturation enzyme AslB (radical SAM superfamily)
MGSTMSFPIKTATACQLKWTWSTIWLNSGTTSSCHRVGQHHLPLNNFDNFHNTPEKLAQREIMLAGEWPQPLPYMEPDAGCRYCQKIEAAGGQSDRQFHIQIPNLAPKELDDNPTAIVVTPKILEIFLNNACNLSCTYCEPRLSSQIENENRKWGKFEKNGVLLDNIKSDKELNRLYTEKFFQWMENNSNELVRLHVLGGEPLYQKDFYRILDFLESHPNKNLELNIVTNLMVEFDKLKNLLERIKSMIAKKVIRRFDITVSLDCWGAEQEYARWGIKLITIEQNINLLLSHKWIFLNINSTLSPLTLGTFYKLIEKINQWKKQHNINHYFMSVKYPSYHNPDIFGSSFWKEAFTKAFEIMSQDDWHEQNSYKYLKGIESQIGSSQKKPDEILKLITHLDELDRRRGTNWQIIYPHIKNLIDLSIMI